MAWPSSQQTHAGTRIRLCGPLRFEINGRDVTAELPDGQPTSVLCYLLASPDRAADRDELIAVLWPERPPREPSAALRPILSRLRRVRSPPAVGGAARLPRLLPQPGRLYPRAG